MDKLPENRPAEPGPEESTNPQFIGPYRITGHLGEGGAATVLRGWEAGLDREVAIKIINIRAARLTNDPVFISRFKGEAQKMASLIHPNILPIYNYGEDEERGLLYIAGMYANAGSLSQRLKQKTFIPLRELVTIMEQVCSALQYAHERGIVHRDIKPANILCGQIGQRLGQPTLNYYVADFGIAKLTNAEEQLTAVDTILGTPEFMSPEQSISTEIDGRADIYSLGIMLFQMLTGRLPFRGQTPIAVIQAHISQPIPSPRNFRPTITPELVSVIERATAKNPAERYQTAGELAEAFWQAAQAAGFALADDISSTSPQQTSGAPFTPAGLRLNTHDAPPSAPSLPTIPPVSPTPPPPPSPAATVTPLPPPATLGGDEATLFMTGSSTLVGETKSRKAKVAWPWALLIVPLVLACSGVGLGGAWVINARLKSATPGQQIPADHFIRTFDNSHGHSQAIETLALSPDGNHLLSGSDDNTAIVWDSGGIPVNTISKHSGSVNSVAYSPDGSIIATAGSDNVVYTWDSGSGAPLETLKGYTARVNSVAFSPDSKELVTGSDDKDVRIWDAQSSKLLHLFSFSFPVKQALFSNDMQSIIMISQDDRNINIIDIKTGDNRFIGIPNSQGSNSALTCLALSADHKHFAAGTKDNQVYIGDLTLKPPQIVGTLSGHSAAVNSVAFSPDGKMLVTAGADKTAILWDAVTYKKLLVFKGHTAEVTAAIFSADGQYVITASKDATIRLYHV